jgi:5-enolpyruvylshikimate-3-phosphate synthase
MAMSFALAGARIPGVVLRQPNCVAKTYPLYFEDMRRIGLQSKFLSGVLRDKFL